MKTSYSILYVDDDIDDLFLISEAFGKFAHALAVVHAENGVEGLKTLEKMQENLPCLVIIDINMPIMDGLETTAYLKKIKSAIKVIFFSSEDSTEFAPKGLALGAEGFIAKDAPFAELNNMLLSVLSRPQQGVA